ncbi:restriction endonuclease subunit S [Shewanella algae]|uniref:restriction endonuclease subunit S n=1 Tax=Shewanella algae TaxID=38313 RepID=UPI001AAD0C4C|nr:restriction endonuclease subunit S [Shewanella algae]MBO2622860.1 restriction endonuclease subunit S [Shewanella algae]
MTNLSGINLNNGSAVGSKREGMDSPSQSLALMSKYDAYKNSGVEWLGDIPSSWMLKRFKHHYRSAMGETILASDLVVDGSIPVFSATEGSHFFGYVNSSGVILERGDLVIPARGNSIGFPKLVDQKSTCSQTTIYAKQIKKISQSFCFYYLLGCKPYLFQFVQTAIPQITVDEVKNNWLVVPSIEEQTRIANFLDKKTAQIDEAIAIKEQQINLLKERKQIIIQQAVTQGLDPNVPMKDSGVDWIGKIPAHWEMKRVKIIFRLVMQPSEKNNDYELLSVYTDIGVKPRRELEERGNKASTTDGYWFVKKGDIVVNKLLAWMGAIGLSEYEGVTSPAYDILRPKLPINGFFYHYLFRSDFCSAELKRHSRGIMDMRLRLYFDRFGVVEVPYPPVDEQNEIIHSLETEMKEMDKGIEHLNTQIEKLKEYKTTLINSAVTGKIKITPEMVEQ